MPDYRRMYLRLFDAAERTIELLAAGRWGYDDRTAGDRQAELVLAPAAERARVREAIELLIAAQRECEEIAMEEPAAKLVLLPKTEETPPAPPIRLPDPRTGEEE